MATLAARKRYSAMNIGSPWRGLNVIPNTPISTDELAAVMFLYAGFPEADGSGIHEANLGAFMVREPIMAPRDPQFKTREPEFRRRS